MVQTSQVSLPVQPSRPPLVTRSSPTLNRGPPIPTVRALLTDPCRVREGLYRRFVRRAQVDGLLADHLYAGEPYLALNAVVLERSEADLLARLTEVFSTAFDRAGRQLAHDVAAVQELGFPWAAAELLGAELPRVPVVGRFDFVRDQDGHWWLLEFNADTPSGIREAIVADRVAYELLPEARGLGRPNQELAAAVVACFVAATRELPPGGTLGIVTDAGELEDLSQMVYTRALLHQPLAARGIASVLGDVDNLRASRQGLTLAGQPVAALYRYVPFESIFGTPAFAAIFDAVAGGKLRLLNGLYGLLLQHKGLVAWLWEHRADPLFTAEERAAIADHLPPTWPIAGDGELAAGGAVVVKQVFGREGEEVFFAEDLSTEAWQQLRQRRTYVVQRRVSVGEIDVAVQTSLGNRLQRGHPTVGSFAAGGRWAGYYTRFGAKIITARAKWLATFVEKG